MIRAEMMARISSVELSKWMAKARVEGEEAEYARLVAESSDGIVHVSERDDVDDEIDDGTAE